MPEKPREDIRFDDFVNIDLTRATRHLQATFQSCALTETGLNLQEWRSLLNLARYGDSHLRELARRASLDATHTSRAALALEKKGLIRRYDDVKDSRRKRLAVTPDGHAMVDAVWAKALGLDAEVRAQLGKTRYRALREALQMIMQMEADAPGAQKHAAE